MDAWTAEKESRSARRWLAALLKTLALYKPFLLGQSISTPFCDTLYFGVCLSTIFSIRWHSAEKKGWRRRGKEREEGDEGGRGEGS